MSLITSSLSAIKVLFFAVHVTNISYINFENKKCPHMSTKIVEGILYYSLQKTHANFWLPQGSPFREIDVNVNKSMLNYLQITNMDAVHTFKYVNNLSRALYNRFAVPMSIQTEKKVVQMVP